MAAFLFKFEWDPAKDRTNVGQHGVDFERAVEVFRDPFGSFQPGGGPGPKCGSMRNSMKPEYDFSNGERGKFFKANAELRMPIYLGADVQRYLTERAAEKGVPLGEMVNGLLKHEIQIIESVK